MNFIEKVEMTDDELALFNSIIWDEEELIKREYEERIEQLEKIGQLATSLLERGAIPEVRLQYFLDPEMNIGGRGKSRKDVFEMNGTRGNDILSHPHFIKYLKYFIHGPGLPNSIIEGFCRIIEEDAGTSGDLLNEVSAFVRKEVRSHRRRFDPSKVMANQFFQLANEIGVNHLAESVRKAAMSVR